MDEFVKQLQTLEYLDITFQDVKDRIDLNINIFNLCVKFELVGKQGSNRRFIEDTN